MILFKRKKENTYPEFDREKQIPVLKCSICTGEKVACFRDKRTGHTEEIMYIRSQGDMQDFLSRYGLSEQESSAADWSRAAFTMRIIPLLQAALIFYLHFIEK